MHIPLFDLKNPFKLSDKELGRLQVELKGDVKILFMYKFAILELFVLVFLLDRFITLVVTKRIKRKSPYLSRVVKRYCFPSLWRLLTIVIFIVAIHKVSIPQPKTEFFGCN